MKWNVEKAKNGVYTLKLNGFYLYSKYRPKEDVAQYCEKKVDSKKKNIILFGLGLGYHCQEILRINPGVQIYVILADKNELILCETYGDTDILNNIHVKLLIDEELPNEIVEDAQIIIPNVWLNAIGEFHPLHSFLKDIKIRQLSYLRFKGMMENNFKENIKYFKPININALPKNRDHAVLVSSGPSLNSKVKVLKEVQNKLFILSVGSALKPLIINGVKPNAVIISDAQENIQLQLSNVDYTGVLFFLSTANSGAVSLYKGNKQMLLQEGYSLADKLAIKFKQPQFATGGSVATTAFSLLEWIGFKNVYLVGQDLGFTSNNTHVEGATSNSQRDVSKLPKVKANDGTYIYTTENLQTYKRWFEKVFSKTKINVWNLSERGSFIANAKFINEMEFINKTRLNE